MLPVQVSGAIAIRPALSSHLRNSYAVRHPGRDAGRSLSQPAYHHQDSTGFPESAVPGGVVGIGDPSQPPPYNVDKAKINNRNHFYIQDTWKVRPRLTLNYGLGWSFESTLVNGDLDKPKYLAPLYGSDLTPTNNNYHNFTPAIGFAYQADKSAKTVIRGGFGIYFDTESLWRRLQERAFTGPVGNGRIQYPAGGFTNIFPGIVTLNTGLPVAVGQARPRAAN